MLVSQSFQYFRNKIQALEIWASVEKKRSDADNPLGPLCHGGYHVKLEKLLFPLIPSIALSELTSLREPQSKHAAKLHILQSTCQISCLCLNNPSKPKAIVIKGNWYCFLTFSWSFWVYPHDSPTKTDDMVANIAETASCAYISYTVFCCNLVSVW